MASREQVEAHDVYERIRPILEEYFDNWIICGHRAGTYQPVALGHAKPGWGDMKPIRNEIRKWQKKSVEDTGKVPPSISKITRKKTDSD